MNEYEQVNYQTENINTLVIMWVKYLNIVNKVNNMNGFYHTNDFWVYILFKKILTQIIIIF